MNRGVYQRYKQLAKQQTERQSMVREVIAQRKVTSREQLLHLLRDAGVNADLATITRDLQEFQVEKDASDVYVLPDEREVQRKRQQLEESLNKYALAVNHRIDFLVIRTKFGCEDSTSEAIRNGLGERIIGTVTGNETILVIAEDDRVGKEALQEVKHLSTL